VGALDLPSRKQARRSLSAPRRNELTTAMFAEGGVDPAERKRFVSLPDASRSHRMQGRYNVCSIMMPTAPC